MAGLLSRLISALRPAPRALIETRGDDGPDIYAGMVAGGYPTPPDFDVTHAMSSLGAFPWVRACVTAIVDDINSLPIKVERELPSGAWESIDHPAFFALLDSPVPSGRASGMAMRRQIIADYVLTNMSYLWLDQPRSPQILRRVHPSFCEATQDGMGLPVSWAVGDVVVENVPPDRIIQARGISWNDNPAAEIYASPPIESLQRLLSTELAVMDGMRRSSRIGRPDAVVMPPEGREWTPDHARKIATWLREWLTSKGGTLIFPFGGAKWETFGHSPKDMEYTAALERITSATLAVFRVPPTRVGIQAANYATAQQESLLYWEAREAEAAVLDDQLTRLARRWPGFEAVRVRRDFSNVDAFVTRREGQINRASMHILNGMDPVVAYEIEGLSFPDSARAKPAADPAPATKTVPDHSARHLRAVIERLEAAETAGIDVDQARTMAATLRTAMRPRVAP